LNVTATPAPVASQTDGWSARYTGTFHADTAARYRFSLTAGGQATVRIDGKEVLTYVPGRESVRNAFLALTAGDHAIEVTYVSAAPAGGRTPRTSLVLGSQAGYDRLHQEAAAAARAADVAVVVLADVTSEGMDRSTLALPADQNELVAAVAAANPRTVVVLNTSGAVVMPWLGNVQGVIANWYAGQEQGNAVAALLFGDAEPGGRLPETFPASDRQGPAKTGVEFPGDGVHVFYDEGLAVGYRWYQASGEKPLFPFGFGLSYTTFRLGGLRLSRTPGGLRAQVTITNTGRRTGSEVVQLYVAAPDAAQEPAQQLKAFSKVTLQPGQTISVALDVPMDELAVWLSSSTGWTVVPGNYAVGAGTSSADLPLRGRVTLP
jgi:beta-glucosidase